MTDQLSQRAKETIGKRLRDLREGAGITVSEIARNASMDRTYIHDIEAGRANWSIDHLARLLQQYHSSLESFFVGMRSNEIPPEHADLFRMLAIILDSRDPDLAFGIRVNLEAISEKAARIRRARDSPSPSKGRARKAR